LPDDFLEILKQHQADGQNAGDQFGGSNSGTGNGLPTGLANNFWFATGIECSYPTIEHGKVRRDLLEECGHYTHWQEDFRLVHDLGLRFLRYGLPYYKIHLGPGRYDWEFADLVMAEMRRLDITPIMDLMHFGVPDWLGNFQNPELPLHFADYADAFAERYPWVRYYTPVNEIYVSANASAQKGLWNEQLQSELGFVNAIKHLCAASILANQRIARRRPDVIIVQSESAEFVHQMTAVPDPKVTLQNELRFLSLDLLYANRPNSDICLYMMDNGLTRAQYDWFMAGKPPGYQIMGNDYYGRNEHLLLPDGQMVEAEDIMGWYGLTALYYQRYHKPIMHTETNVIDPEQAPIWLWKQFSNILRMRGDGVPVLGFTWYSLTDQIDWDVELAEKKGTVNPCGLYDLDRKPRPVAAAYRQLLEEFGQMSLVAHSEVFAVNSGPARLRTDI
jgi:beta-glucosidase/6-phospho-beta-glucosidase/beta-galactosidase